jgi:hypothetical protein
MATKKEEDAEQAFFAEKLKEQNTMDKHTKDAEHQHKAGDEYKDSLGQGNPAIDLEKKNIAEAEKRNKELEAEAKKAEK